MCDAQQEIKDGWRSTSMQVILQEEADIDMKELGAILAEYYTEEIKVGVVSVNAVGGWMDGCIADGDLAGRAVSADSEHIRAAGSDSRLQVTDMRRRNGSNASDSYCAGTTICHGRTSG